ncbi:MAG: polyprenyl synthetase family protein [Bacteroidales bacterium]|jgi:geranylgeranyl diphosphate synthase type II|nr:polyprenyl synthetase family protein [Bacteroidales bacterium]
MNHTLNDLQALAINMIKQEKWLKKPVFLYEPVNYAMSQGGKRIRPLFVLLAADMFGFKSMEKCRSAAVAIEVLHNFTLLHDDIMDNSPFRRGKPSVHKQYNTNMAILSGDTMFAIAIEKVFESEEHIAGKLAKVLAKTAIEICEGQALDMEFETRKDVTIEEYIEMVRLKTSVLIGAALKMGAMIATANTKDIELLVNFGENIGIAFQIQDDILDCWGNIETFGKIKGKDICDNKKTFLYLKALEIADNENKGKLLQLFSDKEMEQTEKINKVIALYENLNIRNIAENMMKLYTEKAFINLQNISVIPSFKTNLFNFANTLLTRKK